MSYTLPLPPNDLYCARWGIKLYSHTLQKSELFGDINFMTSVSAITTY